eukprot:EG_transcript_30578
MEGTLSSECLLNVRIALIIRLREQKARVKAEAARAEQLLGCSTASREIHAVAQDMLLDIERQKHEMSVVRRKVVTLQTRLDAMGVAWTAEDETTRRRETSGGQHRDMCQYCLQEEADAYYLCSHPKHACLDCAEGFLAGITHCPDCRTE